MLSAAAIDDTVEFSSTDIEWPVITDALTDPIVKAAIEALQKGDRKAWLALFESDAKLYDDGALRSLEKFTRDALGHERFTSINRVDK